MKTIISALVLSLSLISFNAFSAECEQNTVDGLKIFLEYIRDYEELGEIEIVAQVIEETIVSSSVTHKYDDVFETYVVVTDIDDECIVDGIYLQDFEFVVE